jgi:hypothetical protein
VTGEASAAAVLAEERGISGGQGPTCEAQAMAFGQQSGPPASARQVRQLTELVLAAGHSDLRDARGPLGLTQRQAGGRFTRDEAEELIARLEAAADADGLTEGAAEVTAPAGRVDARVAKRLDGRTAELRRVPDEVLAAELQRRGWAVVQP